MEHVNTPAFIYYANTLPCHVRKKCILGTSYGTVKKIHNHWHLNSVKNIYCVIKKALILLCPFSFSHFQWVCNITHKPTLTLLFIGCNRFTTYFKEVSNFVKKKKNWRQWKMQHAAFLMTFKDSKSMHDLLKRWFELSVEERVTRCWGQHQTAVWWGAYMQRIGAGSKRGHTEQPRWNRRGTERRARWAFLGVGSA